MTQERAGPRWFHNSQQALAFMAPFDRKHRMLENMELSARSGCDYQKSQPNTSSSTLSFPLYLGQGQLLTDGPQSLGTPNHRLSTEGSHTHRAASSALSIPCRIKNSQGLPNTECQCYPRPHCFPWPYPLTETPSEPCCRQMGLLNDFTALLSDNCFF